MDLLYICLMLAIIFFLFINNQSYAETKVSSSQLTTINSVLFSEGNQSWTLRDFNLYKKLVLLLTGKEKLSEFSNNINDDFLLSRIVKREAVLFEIQPEKLNLNSMQRADLYEYSKNEIKEEIEAIALASALLNLKEKQMSQKARFKAWVDVLKRKYAVKIKSNEFAK